MLQCVPKPLHSRQVNAKPPLAVAPALFELKSALSQRRLNHLIGVFVTVLRMDAFSGLEIYVHVQRRDEDRLSRRALQIDFHARLAPVPESNMAKQFEIEIRIQLTIQARQKILCEARRNTLGVVIGGDKYLGALGKIGPQQQCVTRPQRLTDAA